MAELWKDGLRPWEREPELFEINRRPVHAETILFASKEDAVAWNGNRKQTSLNGSWKFQYFSNPAACDAAYPDGLEQILDTAEWGFIKVPANWQMEGFDGPQYVNVKYPWELTEDIMPPQIPRVFNPIGIYSRSFFAAPKAGEHVILRFDGVESCAEVYVNGQFVGYTEGSFQQHEFEVTPYLTEGENQLVVRVVRWCTGSWLEDQDFFRLSGIFRDVTLYTLPETHICDYKIDGGLKADNTTGTLLIEASVGGADETTEVTVTVYDREKNPVWSTVTSATDGKFVVQTELSEVAPWSAEDPALYTVVMTLNKEEAVVACRTGFRRFEVIDRVMYLNGKRIIFKGANRHEFGSSFGRAITKDVMEADILTFKRNNINAVRTSHYPNHPYWYDLCDEYGVYMIDETNMETHGTWTYGVPEADQLGALPGCCPEWTALAMDRVRGMYYRDRNHASILIWSLGNESYAGTAFREMITFLHEQDKTRLVHYEGEKNCAGYEDTTDINSSMYTTPQNLEKFIAMQPDKPAILCEYAHAMGNSCGDLFKYTKAFDEIPQMQGGFIWDFVDQAIETKDENGVSYLGYGGDFGEEYHDGNFSGNGLMFADRTETPKIKETKVCYQNVDFAAIDWSTKTVTIRNKHLFTDLNAYILCWSLYAEEKKLAEGELSVDCKPGQMCDAAIPMPDTDGIEGELILNLTLVLKETTCWAEKGFWVAKGQFICGERKEWTPAAGAAPVVTQTYGTWIITGADFVYRISKRSGQFYSIQKNGKEYLNAPIRPNFWHATTDNDRGSKQLCIAAGWRVAGEQAGTWTMEVTTHDTYAEIPMKYMIPMTKQVVLESTVRVYSDGTLTFDNTYHGAEGLANIPEIGLMFCLPETFDRMEWFGRGEHENYIDRKESAFVGTWQSKVADRMVSYLKPQECGNMTDVRRLAVMARSGESLIFEGLPTVEASVLPYLPEEMETALHHKDLGVSKQTVVRINYRQEGVGGDDSWSANARPHEEFRIPAEGTYQYSFVVKVR